MKQYSGIKVLKPEKGNCYIYSSIKCCIILGQFFGILTSFGLDLNAKRKSMRVFYTFLIVFLLIVSPIICHIHSRWTKFNLTHFVIIVFYLFGIVTQLSYLHLAQNFSKFIDEWHNNDDIMNQNYGYPNNLNLRLKLLTLLCIVLYTGEVFFCVSFHFKRNIYGCEHDSRKKILSKNIFPEVYYHNNIHLVFKAISALASSLCTFTLVYNDLFIIVISTCLTLRFNQITRSIFQHQRKFKNDEYWRSVRENYDKLSVLCTNLDNHISFLILLSFANNIFFVLIQVHYGLRLKSDAIGGSYFFYSFVHQLARLISVSLHAAWINDESKKPRAILDSLPSTTYNLEIQRLAVQISLDNVVLTGSKLFRIRRGLILNIARAIVTYELVFIQMSSNSI